MTNPFAPTSSPFQQAFRRAFVRTVAAAALLVAGVVTVHGLEAMLNATFDKPYLELDRPLPSIATVLGVPTRYTQISTDEVLDPETVETLGTNNYLVRRYRDTTLQADSPGSQLNLNVNYYGTGSSTPHVPEICWAGSGREEVPDSRVMFVVKGVKRRDGSLVDLQMKMISFVPPGGVTRTASGEPQYSNVAYVFHVNGEYVSNTAEVSSRFWKASYRYAYHCKIEVTPLEPIGDKPNVLTCTQAQAQEIVGDFIREALPEIEACLPDPAVLTKDETPNATDHSK